MTEALYAAFLQSSGVTTDSRNCPAGSLFIALRGDKFNGNAYAARALEAGCRWAVVDDPRYLPENDTRYLLADNGLHALQQLARRHRREMGTPVIGITGTNGKTTTKELVTAVLAQKHRVLHTQGNLNNSIGVPLTLLRLRPEHQIAVVEMGASHPGDIAELTAVAEPDYGLITNVGRAHLEGFGSIEGVARTKGELYDFLRRREEPGTVFINHEDSRLQAMTAGLSKVEYGTENRLFVSGELQEGSCQMAFSWRHNAGKAHHVQTRLVGGYNLPNALAAIAVGLHFHVPPRQIDEALETYTPNNARSQWVQTERNQLIVDAYNANPSSMLAALENFSRLRAQNKMLILGDMRELGQDSAEEHRRMVEQIEEMGFEQVMLVGAEFSRANHHYPTFANVEALIETLKADPPQGRCILIKGSNGIRLSVLPAFL